MIEFIQNLMIMWDKKKGMTLLKMERHYLLGVIDSNKDKEKELRAKLNELNQIKNPRENTNVEKLDIENKINKIRQYSNAFVMTCEKIEELKDQMELYKGNLKNKLKFW